MADAQSEAPAGSFVTQTKEEIGVSYGIGLKGLKEKTNRASRSRPC